MSFCHFPFCVYSRMTWSWHTGKWINITMGTKWPKTKKWWSVIEYYWKARVFKHFYLEKNRRKKCMEGIESKMSTCWNKLMLNNFSTEQYSRRRLLFMPNHLPTFAVSSKCTKQWVVKIVIWMSLKCKLNAVYI